MTDDQPDKSTEQEDEVLLSKVDSMLHRHRREHFSLIHEKRQDTADESTLTPSPAPELKDTLSEDTRLPLDGDGVPVLTEQVVFLANEWPTQTEISELLYFAFDAALRETHIHLNPAERLTLIQALAKRLPGNF